MTQQTWSISILASLANSWISKQQHLSQESNVCRRCCKDSDCSRPGPYKSYQQSGIELAGPASLQYCVSDCALPSMSDRIKAKTDIEYNGIELYVSMNHNLPFSKITACYTTNFPTHCLAIPAKLHYTQTPSNKPTLLFLCNLSTLLSALSYLYPLALFSNTSLAHPKPRTAALSTVNGISIVLELCRSMHKFVMSE
jgi:hypothetical protein